MDTKITSLPETALVKIMEYLTLSDRFRISLTCRQLNVLFHHPSLWTHLNLTVAGGYCGTNIPSKYHKDPVFDPQILDKHFKTVEKFGHNIQHIKVNTLGYFLEFPPEWPRLLLAVAVSCRLQSLTVKATKLIPNIFKLQQYSVSATDYLTPIANLVRSSNQLNSFSLLSWPSRMDDPDCTPEVDILRSLLSNEKTKNLRSLKLFWIDEADGWVERNQEFPTPEETVTIVSHFENLTHLSLRLQMLSDNLLVEMSRSRRCRFEKLEILIIQATQAQKHQFPVLSPNSWSMITNRCPDFRVKMVVMNRVKTIDLDAVLMKPIALEEITFLEHSRIDEEIISSISERYADTLTKFECYCESVPYDTALMNMVEKCAHITRLVYLGQIHHTVVIKLAKLRGHKWQTLKFLESALITQDSLEPDPDTVVGTGHGGELYLVSIAEFHEDVDHRKTLIDSLNTKVTEILGYKWTLCSNRTWK